MQRKVRIFNKRASVIDLSAIRDVEDKPVTLQPKDMPKSSRVCYEGVLDHPHVQDFLKAKHSDGTVGWIGVEHIAVAHRIPTREEILAAGYSEEAVDHIIARETAVAADLAAGLPREEAGQAFMKARYEKMEAEERARREAEEAAEQARRDAEEAEERARRQATEEQPETAKEEAAPEAETPSKVVEPASTSEDAPEEVATETPAPVENKSKRRR